MTGAFAGALRQRIGHVEVRPRLYITLYFALLFGTSARFVLPGLGTLGTPSTVLSVVAFAWWLCDQALKQSLPKSPLNFGKVAVLGYLLWVITSWSLGQARVLSETEMVAANISLVMTVGYTGVALVTIDGVTDRIELETVVRRLVAGVSFMVVIGMIQFLFAFDLSQSLRIPGTLLNNDAELTIGERSSFNRPRGTALHPIEFGVVAASTLPVAYWLARYYRGLWTRLALGLLGFGSLISLSRSAILCAIVSGAVILLFATWRQRAVILASAVAFVLAAGVVVDGLVGTIRSLIVNAGNDPSVQARLDRFSDVVALVSEYPYLGRGFGTYTIADYFLLDNQLQMIAIESGLIGLAIFCLFMGSIVVLGLRVRARLRREQDRDLAVSVTALICGVWASMYTFDAFFYRILMGVLFVSIGLIGSVLRIAERDGTAS